MMQIIRKDKKELHRGEVNYRYAKLKGKSGVIGKVIRSNWEGNQG